MKGSIKVLFWLYKSKKNAQGLMPVYIRITLNREKTETASGYFILESYWNNKKCSVKDSCPQGKEINNALEIQKGKIIAIYNELLSSGGFFSVLNIKRKFLGQDEQHKTLLQAVDYHNKKIESLVGKSYAKGTYDNYIYLADKLAAFVFKNYGKKDLPLEMLGHQFLAEFDQYLRTIHSNKTNTVAKNMSNFKAVINMALDMEWIVKDPFRNHKNKKEEPERTYLTEEEVKMLIDTPMPNGHLQAIKDCMIFQIYTGLAYADLKKLSSSNITRGADGDLWIDLRRQKTGSRTALPLLPEAKVILAKYEELAKTSNGVKLLPVISNQKTFATTITLSRGVPIETVSKMLGHSDLKTTAMYAKVIDTKVSFDMQKLMGRNQNKNRPTPKPD
jgi:integrase